MLQRYGLFVLFMLLSWGMAQTAEPSEVIIKHCMSLLGWQNANDVKQELLEQAKLQAATELYGEFISREMTVENREITENQVVSAVSGYVRVDGDNVNYLPSGVFGEECIEIIAYVTAEDRQRLDPYELKDRVCVDASDDDTRSDWKKRGIVALLRNHRGEFADIQDQYLLDLALNPEYSGGTDQGNQYCQTIEVKLIPLQVEILINKLKDGPLPSTGGVTVSTSEELIEAAREGGIIHLAAGTYELSETLELSGTVSLIGEGQEVTIIRSGAAGSVVRYIGSAGIENNVSLQELSILFDFKMSSEEVNTNVLVINQAPSFEIVNVLIEGGNSIETDGLEFGKGLVITDSHGNISNIVSQNNDSTGVAVQGASKTSFGSVVVKDNKHSGIFIYDSAGVVLENITAQYNLGNGLGVMGQAVLEEAKNVNSNFNQDYGLVVADSAKARVSSSQFVGNKLSGIYVTGTAELHINQSSIDTQIYGIVGVAVGENALAYIDDNTVKGDSPVWFFNSATGRIRGNILEDYHGSYGIHLQNEASPTYGQNTGDSTVYDGR